MRRTTTIRVLVVAGVLPIFALMASGPVSGSSACNQVGEQRTRYGITEVCRPVGGQLQWVKQSSTTTTLRRATTKTTKPPARPARKSTTTTVKPSKNLLVASMSSGANHTCAALANGTAKCWGSNASGQLGDGNVVTRLVPVDVIGLTGVTQINASGDHTCAVLTNGTVKCWGSNASGQLGDGTNVTRLVPVDVIGLTDVRQISASGNHTCAVLTNGTAKCWGSNASGQLGDGTNVTRLVPVDVIGLTDVRQISAGISHACAVLTNSTAKCWGNNSNGQLGDGSNNFIRLVPVHVFELSDVRQISAGVSHTCAVLTNGTAKCWGRNESGQLGDGSTFSPLRVPVHVIGLTGVTQISASGNHTCAVMTNGTAKCWGNNASGQLGNGSNFFIRLVPVDVFKLSDVRQISAGVSHACAVLTNGTAKCWGWNQYGQLGDGTNTSRGIPIDVLIP
jgi:alpha-tubulin suppressor-like RCC1 family protein